MCAALSKCNAWGGIPTFSKIVFRVFMWFRECYIFAYLSQFSESVTPRCWHAVVCQLCERGTHTRPPTPLRQAKCSYWLCVLLVGNQSNRCWNRGSCSSRPGIVIAKQAPKECISWFYVFSDENISTLWTEILMSLSQTTSTIQSVDQGAWYTDLQERTFDGKTMFSLLCKHQTAPPSHTFVLSLYLAELMINTDLRPILLFASR